jgi:hypothetical protein
MGMAYKVTDRNYKKVLESIRDTGGVDIEALGTRLGDVVNITDMSKEEAADKLENLKEN